MPVNPGVLATLRSAKLTSGRPSTTPGANSGTSRTADRSGNELDVIPTLEISVLIVLSKRESKGQLCRCDNYLNFMVYLVRLKIAAMMKRVVWS